MYICCNCEKCRNSCDCYGVSREQLRGSQESCFNAMNALQGRLQVLERELCSVSVARDSLNAENMRLIGSLKKYEAFDSSEVRRTRFVNIEERLEYIENRLKSFRMFS